MIELELQILGIQALGPNQIYFMTKIKVSQVTQSFTKETRIPLF